MADGPNKPNRPIRPRQGAPGRKRRVVIEGGGQRPGSRQPLGVPAAQIIKIMMDAGQLVQITQSLSDDEVELIGVELSREITIKHAADEE